MKKVRICILCLCLLTGCSQRITAAEAIQERYAQAQSGHLEAEIVYHLPDASRSFTVRTVWSDQTATTTILKPEEVSGLSATASGEELVVNYGGGAISVGDTAQDLSPAVCVPLFLRAAAKGYILEAGKESVDGLKCLRLTFDTGTPTAPQQCTAWFTDDAAPYYIEFSRSGQTVLTLRVLDFGMKSKE